MKLQKELSTSKGLMRLHLEANIKQNALSLKKLEEEVKITTLSLAALKEPEMLTLPTEMSISQELKDAHLEFFKFKRRANWQRGY